ncbi:ABC transporter ATP-binding protein [bacterium]|nr:ABC transporter ATP-binding protein [bacterium]
MNNLIIKTEGLAKVFKETTYGGLKQKTIVALDNLHCEVFQGEVFAFLGPNGAGKTTTIKLLTRLIFPTRGRVWLFGKENVDHTAMKKVGYLPEQPNLYGYLTGKEFLNFIAQIFGLDKQVRRKRIDVLIERVGLSERVMHLIRNYSRGMVQRLGLAQALINDPSLLILDEPMASLDPVGRKDFRDLILELKNQGKTIFFSSHILSDAEMIADRIGILNRGKLVSVGKLDDLSHSQTQPVEVTFIVDSSQISQIDLVKENVIVQGNRVLVRLDDKEALSSLLRQIDKWGGRLESIIPQRKSLEDYFMTEVRK